MDELLDIDVGVEKIGNSSLTMRFEAYCAADRALRATAQLTVVCVEKTSITKRVIPDWVRAALSPYVVGMVPVLTAAPPGLGER
jgi:acyl-CoA thioesterase FadM